MGYIKLNTHSRDLYEIWGQIDRTLVILVRFKSDGNNILRLAIDGPAVPGKRIEEAVNYACKYDG